MSERWKKRAESQGRARAKMHFDAGVHRARKRQKESDDQWLYGIHAVQSALENNPQRVLEVALLQDNDSPRLVHIADLAKAQDIAVHAWTAKAMAQRVEERHQGVMARCRPLPVRGEAELREMLEKQGRKRFLVLDEVTDAHNLGACLRNADAFGITAVIVPEDQSARLTPVVCKVAVGAAETVPLIRLRKTNQALRLLREAGVLVVGTALVEGAVTLQDVNCLPTCGDWALVMGSEGAGLRDSTRALCDTLVALPMHGYVDSLNVSVASGVFLFAMRTREN